MKFQTNYYEIKLTLNDTFNSFYLKTIVFFGPLSMNPINILSTFAL